MSEVFGKRNQSSLKHRQMRDGHSSPTKDELQPILDFILQNAKPDDRPYLQVSVFGRNILGLLDTGATRTILGRKGWSLIEDLGIKLNKSESITVKVANGTPCHSIGNCQVPVTLRDRTKLINMVVLPDFSHTLILGVDFFKDVGIIPDLRHVEWYFADEVGTIEVVDYHLQSKQALSILEQKMLQAVIDRNRKRMGEALGCTSKAEYVILT